MAAALEAALDATAGAPEIERLTRAIEGILGTIASAHLDDPTAQAAGPEAAYTPLEDFRPEDQVMLRRLFLEEATEHLEAAQRALRELGDSPDDRELYAKLLRSLHTIKGAAGTVGIREIAQAAHLIEDEVATLEGRGAELAPEERDGLLAGIDVLRSMIEADSSESPRELLGRLAAQIGAPHTIAVAGQPATAPPTNGAQTSAVRPIHTSSGSTSRAWTSSWTRSASWWSIAPGSSGEWSSSTLCFAISPTRAAHCGIWPRNTARMAQRTLARSVSSASSTELSRPPCDDSTARWLA
jgi:chemotaxis protein histidine kinase CheA